ncbi:MAG TPA: SusD/RagB family nutrient-binding outer membrane lipoprotein, partial [Pedobacter sp.]|uniref:SusD/RagB family nutrient-binding outer membrane lipoprotein n=1 Tax=Pedobacter sp. TaxID=1411316 RepID=UPI002CD67E0B
MKTNSIKIYSLLLIIIFAAASCTKDFKDINTNPVAYGPTNFDPNYTLTTAQLNYTGSIDFAYDTWRGNLIYSGTMMQGLSSVISYWAGDKYLLNEGYTAAYWGNNAVGAYIEQVRPIVDVVEFTKGKTKYTNLRQVARIWKALVFERLTDLYGDVPYSEAGLGFYTGVLNPKYDKQQAIYSDLLKEVEEATAALGTGGDAVTGDALYQGDIPKWKRFGNTLLLRIAMRLTKIDENTAKAFAQKAIANTMTSNADNAFVKHDVAGSRVTQNRNSQVLLGDGGQENYYVKWSKTFIDLLKTSGDPRLGKVAVTKLYLNESSKDQNTAFDANPAVQKGMPNGKDLSGIAGRDVRQDASYTTFPDYSSPNPGMTKRDGLTFILTYAESELLIAEAAQRWAIGGSAATHYANGVKAAITYLGQYDASLAISDATADLFVTAHPYVALTGLQQINTQYWLHANTMLDFYETWSNWRRSGFPVLTPVVYPGNATNGTIPRRFPYPLDEAAKNGANYKAASSAVPGGD